MSISRFIILISFCALFTGKATASSEQTFYFSTDWGEEVQVNVSTKSTFPQFLIYNDHNNDSFELMRQYVKATLERRNYIYGYEESCDECAIGYGAGINAPGQIAPNATGPKIKIPITSKNSVINKVIEVAADQLGSRSVDSVVNLLARTNEASDFPIFMVITNNDNVPTLMCKVIEHSCKMLDDVVFTQFSDGSWGIAYPVPTFDDERTVGIFQAVGSFLASTSVKCRTSFTGSGDKLTAQIVCYTLLTSY